MILNFSRMITKRYRSFTTAPKVLDNFLGLSFGVMGSPRPSPNSIPPRSFRDLVSQLLSSSSKVVAPRKNELFDPLSMYARRISALESELKIERARARALEQEIQTTRMALKQTSELRAELEVEREAGRALVQYLERAESEARKVPALERLLRQREDSRTGRQQTVGNQSRARRPDPR